MSEPRSEGADIVLDTRQEARDGDDRDDFAKSETLFSSDPRASAPSGLVRRDFTEIRYYLARALGGSPNTRARAIAEAETALALFIEAKDDADANETRDLLAKLRAAK